VGSRAQEFYSSNASFAAIIAESVSSYVQYTVLLQQYQRTRKNAQKGESALFSKVSAIARQSKTLADMMALIFRGGGSTQMDTAALAGRRRQQIVIAATDVASAIVVLGEVVTCKYMGGQKSKGSVISNLSKSINRTRRDSSSIHEIRADDVICRLYNSKLSWEDALLALTTSANAAIAPRGGGLSAQELLEIGSKSELIEPTHCMLPPRASTTCVHRPINAAP
jgi:hypothetical protein